MTWRCFTCEHVNQPNLAECEACGAERNLYAEELVDTRERLKKERSVNTLKLEESKRRIKELEVSISASYSTVSRLQSRINVLSQQIVDNESLAKVNELKSQQLEFELTATKRKLAESQRLVQYNERVLNESKAQAVNLNSSLNTLNDKFTLVKKRQKFSYLLIPLILSIVSYITLYKPYVNRVYLNNTNALFENFLDSIPQDECALEDSIMRKTFIHDINKVGNVDGIVLATFKNVYCRNTFKQLLFITNPENKRLGKFNSYELSIVDPNGTYDSYYSFEGIENDTIVLGRLKLNIFNNRKKIGKKKGKSYSRLQVYTSMYNDTLYTKPISRLVTSN